MSLNSVHYEICGKTFSRLQLLMFAGVHGIHRTLQPSERIILEVTDIGEGAVLDIFSPKIAALQVVIYPSQRLVRNHLLINFKQKSGAAFNWVQKQTQYTQNKNYERLEANATREDDFRYTNIFTGKECICPLIGYLVWMKFGYVMTVTEREFFESFLKQNKKNSQSILNLINADEKLWQEKGYSWNGFFNLKPGSESYTILKEYRPGVRN
jgi:hypothetical protein